MRLLLTGFEPFAGSPINPSEQVVRALEREGIPGIDLQTAILPVDRVQGPAALIAAVQRGWPDVVLCLGEATRRMVISIERVAINLMDYRIPDNAGQQVMDEPIVPGGPAAYFSTLPVRAMLDAMCAAGIPAELSLSAGAFLCNQVLYTVLHDAASQYAASQYAAEHHPHMAAGFIHLPSLPQQVAGKNPPIPSMGLETMVIGVKAVVERIGMTGRQGDKVRG